MFVAFQSLRFLQIALAAIVLALLAGCATPSSSGGTTSAPLNQAPAQSAESAPPKTPAPIKNEAAASTPSPSASRALESNPAVVAPTMPVAPVNEGKPATIVGMEESSAMLDNLTVFVVSVDGRKLSRGREGWNTPLAIKPGPHSIGVAFNRGVFSAHTELQFTARAEVAYRVRFATDAQLFGKNSYCDFWIEEIAGGQQVLSPVRATLVRVEKAH